MNSVSQILGTKLRHWRELILMTIGSLYIGGGIASYVNEWSSSCVNLELQTAIVLPIFLLVCVAGAFSTQIIFSNYAVQKHSYTAIGIIYCGFIWLVLPVWAWLVKLLQGFQLITLERVGVVGATPVEGEIDTHEIADMLLWHLCKSVPALEITETLEWKCPLNGHGHWLGVCLIAYKAFVIIPGIRTWLWVSKMNHELHTAHATVAERKKQLARQMSVGPQLHAVKKTKAK